MKRKALERVVEIVAEDVTSWPDPRDGVRHGLERAIELGVIMVAECLCPVGWGVVRDPRCPLHGIHAPRHTVSGG